LTENEVLSLGIKAANRLNSLEQPRGRKHRAHAIVKVGIGIPAEPQEKPRREVPVGRFFSGGIAAETFCGRGKPELKLAIGFSQFFRENGCPFYQMPFIEFRIWA
jgi:hypothetical protein